MKLLYVLCEGCMKEVWVNHKLVDFLNAIRQQKIAPGCSLYDEEGHGAGDDDDGDEYVKEHIMEDDEEDRGVENLDPCLNNKCKHGSQCVPQSPSDYMCKCAAGYSGKFCDQGNDSRKKNFFQMFLRMHFSLMILYK